MIHLPEGFGLFLLFSAISLCALYLFTGLEDLMMDVIAIKNRLRPKIIDSWVLTYLGLLPEKKIAILVPAWKEGKIIGQMLQGNLKRIKYQNYLFLVGCYPNDPDTVAAVRRMALADPRVIPVVNHKEGPTSKGQMLNQLIDYSRTDLKQDGIEAFLLQDSEDVIDPWSLKLMNRELDFFDFVQIPVFSLEVNRGEIVAGTYVDEFAESHTKDLLVRAYLGAGIPSAGVGTAFSSRVIDAFIQKYGWVFYEKSLTEDYEFGIRTHLLGFKGTFAAYGFDDPSTHKRHYIATREYFPKKFRRSVRQKTRWTVGIVMQGWRNLGWSGTGMNRYFLYRDRRGLFTNLMTMGGYLLAGLLGILILLSALPESLVNHSINQYLKILFFLNVPLALYRIAQRGVCVFRIYGNRALWTLPLRWPVAVLINSLACFNALFQSAVATVQRKHFQWVKTEHELPEGFGGEVPVPVMAQLELERSAS